LKHPQLSRPAPCIVFTPSPYRFLSVRWGKRTFHWENTKLPVNAFSLNCAVTVIEGQLPFTTISDGRFKYQVREDVKGLGFIMQLCPVTYQFDVKRFDEQNHGDNDKLIATASYIRQASYDEATAIHRTSFIEQQVQINEAG
jgi:hypothetical protein